MTARCQGVTVCSRAGEGFLGTWGVFSTVNTTWETRRPQSPNVQLCLRQGALTHLQHASHHLGTWYQELEYVLNYTKVLLH